MGSFCAHLQIWKSGLFPDLPHFIVIYSSASTSPSQVQLQILKGWVLAVDLFVAQPTIWLSAWHILVLSPCLSFN